MRTTLKVEGLRELEKALAELPKATAKNVVRKVLKEAAEPMVNAAQSNAPKLSGKLKADIKASTKLAKSQKPKATYIAGIGYRSQGKSTVEMYVGPGQLPQAHLNEFGSRNNTAAPFMRPAFDAEAGGALDHIKSRMGEEIEKSAKRLAAKIARLAKKGG